MNGLNVIVAIKGDERYVWMYDDNQEAACLQSLGRFASNPELSFNWYDAAVAAKQVRDAAKGVRNV